MHPVCVDQSVGDKGPYIRAATRQRAINYKRTVITRWDESEAEQKFDILLLAQQQRAHQMDNHQHGKHRADNGRNIENWLALHQKIREGGTSAVTQLRYPTARWDEAKKKGGLSPSLEPRCGVIAMP